MGSSGSVRRRRRTDFPHGVVRPSSVFSADEVATASVGRALLRPRAPRGAWSLEHFPVRRTPRRFRSRSTSTPGLHSPSGRHRRPPQRREPFFASGSDRRCPSHGVCRPFSGHQLGGSGSPGGSTRRHLASPGFSPPRRLAPLQAFQSFLTGPLLGFAPSGLRSSRRSGALIEQTRALLIVAHPARAHASSVLARTRFSARWIRPREGPGEPSSGLCSLRESVPL